GHERHPEQRAAGEARGTARAGGGHIGRVAFALGVLTTALILLAWITNLFAKPLATLFGGCIILVGVLVALATHTLGRRRGRPAIFPLLYNPENPLTFLSRGRRARPSATVLAALPQHPAQVGALVRAAHDAAAGGAVVLMRRGAHGSRTGPPRIFEIVDPYRDDPTAEDVFVEAERLARQHGWAHRYLYLPSTAGPEVAAGLWYALQPQETLAVAGEDDILSNIPVAEVRRSTENTVPILHYVSG